MGSGFSFSVNGSNGTLAYTDDSGSYYQASVRVSKLSYNYGVTSTESHARDERAFYPHRRIQGQFSLTVDCIGYKEFKQFMTWLQGYATTMLSQAQSDSTKIAFLDVSVPSRNFRKIGVITTGIDDYDQVGSMVFSPELVFVTITDPADPAVSLTKAGAAFSSPQIDSNASLAFYPVTSANYKDIQIYDDLSAINKLAAVASIVSPPVNAANAAIDAAQAAARGA